MLWSLYVSRVFICCQTSFPTGINNKVVLYCIVLHFILFYLLFCIVLYCIVLYSTVLYCPVLSCLVLSFLFLPCLVLSCIALYCIANHLLCFATYCLSSTIGRQFLSRSSTDIITTTRTMGKQCPPLSATDNLTDQLNNAHPFLRRTT